VLEKFGRCRQRRSPIISRSSAYYPRTTSGVDGFVGPTEGRPQNGWQTGAALEGVIAAPRANLKAGGFALDVAARRKIRGVT
jgi:hypothetical protein